MNSLKLKGIFFAIFLLLFTGIFYSIFLRVRSENANRSVELCINWEETLELLEQPSSSEKPPSPISLQSFLERCRIMGVSSIALKEETIEDLLNSGKIIFFSKQEIEKLTSLGLITSQMLKTNLLWLKKDPNLTKRILGALGKTEESFKEIGDYVSIKNPMRSWEKDRNLNVGMDPEQMTTLKNLSFSFVYLLETSEASTDSTQRHSNPRKVNIEPYSKMQSAWFMDGFSNDRFSDYFSFPTHFVEELKKSEANFILFENEKIHLQKKVALMAQRPEQIIRSHTILVEEMKKLSLEKIESRWVRAVKERSCRFLYFRWHPDLDVEENLHLLRGVSQRLKSEGFTLKMVPPRTQRIPSLQPGSSTVYPSFFTSKFWFKFRLLLALLVAIISPLFAVQLLCNYCRKKIWGKGDSHTNLMLNSLIVWSLSVLVVIFSGLLIGCILPEKSFINGLEVFRGVKISLLFPWIVVGFIFYQPRQILEFTKRKVSLLDLSFIFLIFLVIIKFLERSGNTNTAPSLFELNLRSSLENFLGVRPRFKEFLIGHPCIILGAYHLLKSVHQENGELKPSSIIFIWVGTIGLISIVNTFSHLHTPVTISLLRTLHGFWLGGIIGVLLVFGINPIGNIFKRER